MILSDLDFEFPLGTVLKLVRSVNKDKAKTGAKAIVVDGIKLFPILYDKLIANISHEDLEHFIAVIWDKSNSNYYGAEDGFYMKHRFDVHEDQTDFRKVQKEIKDNDGREKCFKCGNATKLVQGFNQSKYNICPICKV